MLSEENKNRIKYIIISAYELGYKDCYESEHSDKCQVSEVIPPFAKIDNMVDAFGIIWENYNEENF